MGSPKAVAGRRQTGSIAADDAQYDRTLPKAATVTIRVDEGWTSWMTTAADGSAVNIPPYGLLGAHLMYGSPSARWDVQLHGSNLLDEYYRVTGYTIASLGPNLGTVALPRMGGVTLNFHVE